MPNSPSHERARVPKEALDVALADHVALAALEAEWQQLWHACPAATPFAAPAWLLPWARHYAPGRCWAATLRAGGRLVGLLPVFCWEGALLLAGTGPSDHSDGLFAPGFEPYAADLLAAAVNEVPEPFDRIDLRQLPPRSPLLDVELDGWRACNEADESCMVAPLAGENGLGSASAKIRSNQRYALRRLEREGGAAEPVDLTDLSEAAAHLEHLHAARWQAKAEEGVLADPLLSALLRDALPALARAGLLRLHRVVKDGATIGLLFGLQGHGRAFYYLSGFDPGFAQLSPGTLLVGTAMEQAARQGCAHFDFLRGQEPYKYRWGAQDEPTRRLRMTRN